MSYINKLYFLKFILSERTVKEVKVRDRDSVMTNTSGKIHTFTYVYTQFLLYALIIKIKDRHLIFILGFWGSVYLPEGEPVSPGVSLDFFTQEPLLPFLRPVRNNIGEGKTQHRVYWS